MDFLAYLLTSPALSILSREGPRWDWPKTNNTCLLNTVNSHAYFPPMPQFRLWLIDSPSIFFGQARLTESRDEPRPNILPNFLPSLLAHSIPYRLGLDSEVEPEMLESPIQEKSSNLECTSKREQAVYKEDHCKESPLDRLLYLPSSGGREEMRQGNPTWSSPSWLEEKTTLRDPLSKFKWAFLSGLFSSKNCPAF